ncbi:MAG TPA: non-heme iron oxygenase ferredoxin subunit [Steroidobacteraceae bacterium]|nr:non-heme iron oxygenase ferredoxin subunit [Steroidobacteraceae bacterium]
MQTASKHFVPVAQAADVPRGSMLEVTVGPRSILLCHTREGWFATDNVCTHAYAKLSEGRLRKTRLICPLHGGAFDCRTGAAIGSPATAPLATYAVRIAGENVEIAVGEQVCGS